MRIPAPAGEASAIRLRHEEEEQARHTDAGGQERFGTAWKDRDG
jgi:hypothetical protein